MSDTPDFDSMSPEEMMRWMESLAKRQGASEGLTTDADMEVDEVSADDERLEGKGDYIPYGWTQEKWEAHLAKEEAEKAARQQAPVPPAPEPAQEAAPAASADGTPDLDNMTPEEMMRWMESLAKRQGGDAAGFTTDADMEVDEVSADDERLHDLPEYKPFGMSDEEWERLKAKDEAERQARMQAQQHATPAQPQLFADAQEAEAEEEKDDSLAAALFGNVLEAPSIDDIFAADNELPEFDADPYEDDEDTLILSTEPQEPQPSPVPEPTAEQNPMDWLAGLTGQAEEPSSELDFDLDGLGDLASLGEDTSSSDPMDWLAGLANDEAAAPAASGTQAEASASAESAEEEGTLEWMESLARRQGADSEELFTTADLDIPHPQAIDDTGPGYEPYSFEAAVGEEADEDELDEALANFAAPQLELENPEAWLDSLATGVGSDSSDSSLDVAESDYEDEAEDYDSITSEVMSEMARGEIDPEKMDAFFKAQFKRAEQRSDLPDYIGADEDGDFAEALHQAQIPEWLQETLGDSPLGARPNQAAEPEEAVPGKTDTAEMMAAALGLDQEIDDDASEALPDWLQPEVNEQDSGDITDIFADIDMSDFEDDLGEQEPAPEGDSVTDILQNTDDSWVQAFVAEESGEMEEWYSEQLQIITEQSDDTAALGDTTAGEAPADELQDADLPVETGLPAGQPQAMPAWMRGDSDETPAAEPDKRLQTESIEMDVSWLSEADSALDDEEMPDWLREQVDDSVAAASEDVPDWLQEEAADIALDGIPDWLRETMDEEQEAVASEPAAAEPVESVEEVPDPAAQTAAVVPAQQSPAPVPVAASNVDVAATLQAARSKINGGDVAGGLQAYEAVVRANAALEIVVHEVQKITEDSKHKKNPAIYRVLGDALMRQGQLQTALDTYRKALNML